MSRRLKEIIKNAYKNVPLYYRLGQDRELNIDDIDEGCNIKLFPTVEKEDFMYDEEIGVSLDRYMDMINGKLLMTSTSGSTGKCMNIYKTRNDDINSMMELWIRRKRYYGINTTDRLCFFYTSPDTDEYVYKNVCYCKYKNTLGFSKKNMTYEKLSTILDMIREFNPIWCIMQPSIMAIILGYIKEHDVNILEGIKYIEFTGEILSSFVRSETEKLFGCKVADQYGCEEANSIAYECPYGCKHIMTSNVYVEILEDGKETEEGKVGDIYITTMNNSTMPFIRYGIGDRGLIRKYEKCDCGNTSPILDVVDGRSCDMIKHADGRLTNKYVFINVIDSINTIYHAICQFQIQQSKIDEFDIRIVLNYDMEEDEISPNDIIDSFLLFLGKEDFADFRFQFEITDRIIPDPITGKVKWFLPLKDMNKY